MILNISQAEIDYLLRRIKVTLRIHEVEITNERRDLKEATSVLRIPNNYDVRQLESRIKVRQKILQNAHGLLHARQELHEHLSLQTMIDRDRMHREHISDLKNLR